VRLFSEAYVKNVIKRNFYVIGLLFIEATLLIS